MQNIQTHLSYSRNFLIFENSKILSILNRIYDFSINTDDVILNCEIINFKNHMLITQ